MANRDPRRFLADIRAQQRAQWARADRLEAEISAASCLVTADEVEASDPAEAASLRESAAKYAERARCLAVRGRKPGARLVSYDQVHGAYWSIVHTTVDHP